MNAKGAANFCDGALRIGDTALDLGKSFRAMIIKDFASLGQGKVVSGSIEQPQFQIVFQARKAPAYSGRRHVKELSSLADASLFHNPCEYHYIVNFTHGSA
jgi:hypothetical protein